MINAGPTQQTIFGRKLGLIAAGITLAISLGMAAPAEAAATLCGDGSAPDYGFSYDLQQPHWMVGWEDFASEETVDQVDATLDRLNADAIAQTMILILPADQVGNRTNCAVHFLRYMKLGLPSGQRKDNGFVYLIVVEPDRIDVHYGVGLGLPALTAPALSDVSRAGENAYQPDHDMNKALLALAGGFDTAARTKYSPLAAAAPTGEAANGQPEGQPQQDTGALGLLPMCLLVCFGGFILLALVWAARRTTSYYPPGYGRGTGQGGFPFGGGGGSWRGGGMGMGGGRFGGGPTMRGGGGSGRSGRGN